MKMRQRKHRYDVPRCYESKRGMKRWIAWMRSKRYFDRWWGYNPELNKHYVRRKAAQAEVQWHS